MYVGHLINLGIYNKELNKRIVGQLIIVDHAHHLWSLILWPLKKKQTTLPSNHPTCCDNILHYILFIKCFILNIIKT
jgi:hypothetical protein